MRAILFYLLNLLFIVTVSTICLQSCNTPGEEIDEDITDFFWVSGIPKTDTDFFSELSFDADEEIAVYNRQSLYEGKFSVWATTFSDHMIAGKVFQSNKKFNAIYSIYTDCTEYFDLCLTITGLPEGPQTYYSWYDDEDAAKFRAKYSTHTRK